MDRICSSALCCFCPGSKRIKPTVSRSVSMRKDVMKCRVPQLEDKQADRGEKQKGNHKQKLIQVALRFDENHGRVGFLTLSHVV